MDKNSRVVNNIWYLVFIANVKGSVIHCIHFCTECMISSYNVMFSVHILELHPKKLVWAVPEGCQFLLSHHIFGSGKIKFNIFSLILILASAVDRTVTSYTSTKTVWPIIVTAKINYSSYFCVSLTPVNHWHSHQSSHQWITTVLCHHSDCH